MAMRRPRRPMRPPRATGGKPPIRLKPPRFKTINGVKKRFTGKGRRGVGLGLHGKGKRITNKGYTGKGARGYGQGHHGVHPAAGATTPTPRSTGHTTQTRSTTTREAHHIHPTKAPRATGAKPPQRKHPGTTPPRTVKTPKPPAARKPKLPSKRSRRIDRRK